MAKKLGSRTFSRLFGRQQSNVGESSSEERTPEIADPAIRPSILVQQTVDLYSTDGSTGIRVIADPTDAALDIVLVHGLTGNRDKTWTHANGVFWPQELAKDIPTARIMTFGYDADVVKLWSMAGSNTLRNHGKNLASDVSDQRRGCRERPIIFIAHSLGGLVCEQALLICREGEAHLGKVFQSTRGIIFMGTPHGGSGLATLGHMFAKYLNVIRHTNSSIIGVLQQKSEVLTAVQQQFQQLVHKPEINISIYCFFEEKAVTGVGVIVSEQSAVLSQYPNQSIAANHMDMTKFSGRNDAGYQRVLGRVYDSIESVNSTPETSTSQKEPLSESDGNLPRAGNLDPASNVPEPGTPPNQTISSTGSGTAIGIGSQNVHGGFHVHHRSHPDLEKESKCQKLLRTSEYERYKERNPYPVEGTCQWFLRHTNYVNWRDSATSSLLWVSADPGCGKSVLSRFLADKELQATRNRTICYFFFKDDNEDQKTTTNALCALLHQLFNRKRELLSHAIEVYNQNGDKFTENVDLLWNILITASADPKAGEIICILDALDECRQSELKYLLQKVCAFYDGLPRVSDKTGLKFLITSRPLQHIADEFNDIIQKLPTIRLAGEEDTDQIKHEIDLVIEAELEKIQQKWQLDQKTLSPLREELSKVEHRTYLWLKLIFELIRKDAQSITRSGRRKLFGTIPDSVDAAYTAILNQSTDKKQAKKLLQIVCTAIRPLSVKEISIAISIQPDDKKLEDLENLPDNYSKNLIRNLCGLFVSVIDGRVYLLHQTAKEFLIGENELYQSTTTSYWIWRHSLSTKDSNFLLAHICMWYLRLEGFFIENLSLVGYKSYERLVSTYDFLEYAAANWAIHFREAAIPMGHTSIALALDICNPEAYSYKTWGLVYWKGSDYYKLPAKLSSLHLASLFGHRGVVAELLTASVTNVNVADEDGRTPLSWAAERGHQAVVELLLAKDGIDVNLKDNDDRTPLLWAAESGHQAVVELLLVRESIDINSKDNDGRTPLFWAAESDNQAVVELLLAKDGIDINLKDNNGRTPLWQAAESGDQAVVELLLAKDSININLKDNDGRTPLWQAAESGNQAVVELLLAKDGIDVNLEDNDGRTPLWRAAMSRHQAVVELLLAKDGIDVDLKDKDSRTPLL